MTVVERLTIKLAQAGWVVEPGTLRRSGASKNQLESGACSWRCRAWPTGAKQTHRGFGLWGFSTMSESARSDRYLVIESDEWNELEVTPEPFVIRPWWQQS